jgi:hypothetical protein
VYTQSVFTINCCIWYLWLARKNIYHYHYHCDNLTSTLKIHVFVSVIFQPYHVTFQWDNEDFCFVLDKHGKLDFCSATVSSLKQQNMGRHVVLLRHTIPNLSQPVFLLLNVACLRDKQQIAIDIVFGLTRRELEHTIYLDERTNLYITDVVGIDLIRKWRKPKISHCRKIPNSRNHRNRNKIDAPNNGCVALFRQPITLTAHYSDNPLLRQPITPTAHFSDNAKLNSIHKSMV